MYPAGSGGYPQALGGAKLDYHATDPLFFHLERFLESERYSTASARFWKPPLATSFIIALSRLTSPVTYLRGRFSVSRFLMHPRRGAHIDELGSPALISLVRDAVMVHRVTDVHHLGEQRVGPSQLAPKLFMPLRVITPIQGPLQMPSI